jgi:hypothetical protein
VNLDPGPKKKRKTFFKLIDDPNTEIENRRIQLLHYVHSCWHKSTKIHDKFQYQPCLIPLKQEEFTSSGLDAIITIFMTVLNDQLHEDFTFFILFNDIIQRARRNLFTFGELLDFTESQIGFFLGIGKLFEILSDLETYAPPFFMKVLPSGTQLNTFDRNEPPRALFVEVKAKEANKIEKLFKAEYPGFKLSAKIYEVSESKYVVDIITTDEKNRKVQGRFDLLNGNITIPKEKLTQQLVGYVFKREN